MFDKLTGTKQRDIIIIPEIKYQNITIGNDKALGNFIIIFEIKYQNITIGNDKVLGHFIIIPEIKYQNITIGNDKVLGHLRKQIVMNPEKLMTNPAA